MHKVPPQPQQGDSILSCTIVQETWKAAVNFHHTLDTQCELDTDINVAGWCEVISKVKT